MNVIFCIPWYTLVLLYILLCILLYCKYVVCCVVCVSGWRVVEGVMRAQVAIGSRRHCPG